MTTTVAREIKEQIIVTPTNRTETSQKIQNHLGEHGARQNQNYYNVSLETVLEQGISTKQQRDGKTISSYARCNYFLSEIDNYQGKEFIRMKDIYGNSINNASFCIYDNDEIFFLYDGMIIQRKSSFVYRDCTTVYTIII